MNAKIFCQNISIETIEEAFILGDYQKEDVGILSIPYKLYKKEKNVIIAFEEAFNFCNLIFVVTDLLEITKNDSRDVLGYVSTNPSNKITEYLKGETVCLYLSEKLKLSLRKYKDQFINDLNLVTKSNKNYIINFDTFSSSTSKNTRTYKSIQVDGYALLKEGVYLYERADYENEYIE